VVSTSDSGEELGVTHPTVSSGAPSQLRESVGHYRHPGSRTGGARSVTGAPDFAVRAPMRNGRGNASASLP